MYLSLDVKGIIENKGALIINIIVTIITSFTYLNLLTVYCT